MIFSGNTTALGASTIPMAEGYDCSYGASLALVESARNDYAVFKAMVQADYKEMSICKESTGVIQEGELATLHEAVGGGIFKKIAELFKKLVAKIKAIFHNLTAKLRSLTMKDKDYVKKYQAEVIRKSGIDKLEVKWRKVKKNGTVEFDDIDQMASFDAADAGNNYKDDSSTRIEYYCNKAGISGVDNTSEFIKEYIDDSLEGEETLEIKDIKGGIRGICSFLTEYDKKLTKMNSNINKVTTSLEKMVKYYNDTADGIAKASVNKDNNNYKAKTYDASTKSFVDSDDEPIKADQTMVENANKVYEMASSYQSVLLAQIEATKQITTIVYKQNKAAFVKAVTVNKKKLEESYVDAIVEAAEDEVDNVINSALSKEELSDFNAASKNVLDNGVSDDPDTLTWEKTDCYTAHPEVWKGKDGCIDMELGGGKVEESAYFGKLFY